MNRAVLPIMALATLMWSVTASARQFSFDVPSKLTNITFESEMEVEDILGTTHSITGELNVNGDSNARFRFAVPVKTLRTGIDMRDTHLQGEMWLNAAKFPEITFEGTKVRKVDNRNYKVSGTFTMRGKSRPLNLDVRVREIDGAKAKKLGLADGTDKAWLRVRGSFKVKLSDHGIKIPGMAAAKVNDEWTVKISLFAVEKK